MLAEALCFNPRPRAGGDLVSFGSSHTSSVFQSTPPRGGRHYGAASRPAPELFQSTPPRGGRLCKLLHDQPIRRRFNPRPRAGGDRGDMIGHRLTRCFNPRPRAGGDERNLKIYPGCLVSIHAPARGATQYTGHGAHIRSFQSTPPRGGRLRGCEVSVVQKKFQSTPPRGGRQEIGRAHV